MRLKNILIAGCGCAFFLACEKSPFNGEISNPLTQDIRGKIALSDADNPAGIHVWMEDTPISATTNAAGEFVVSLPPTASNSPVYANGVFNLYFYVANYRLSSTPVTVVNGRFLYPRGEVNADGELIGTRFIAKLLNISTQIDPPVAALNDTTVINVLVTLSAVRDSVDVVFPKMIDSELGAILFRNLDTGAIIADAPEATSSVRLVKRISTEPLTFSYSFDLMRGILPIGRYEVIPFLFVAQPKMPEGLLASISQKAEEIGPDFLKIPFRRTGGLFTIRDTP